MHALKKGYILQGNSYAYMIEEVLGQGTFGITYRATVKMKGALGSLDSHITVAVKEFFMKDYNERNGTNVTSGSKAGLYGYYKAKFLKEALNLSKLQHPNIVSVVESFEANDTAYYVMAYIPGGSLDSRIGRQGLSLSQTMHYAEQIATALAYMHQHRMLHLDLKPSNIVIDADDNAVLIDFGLSKQYNENGEPESSTNIGAGTPGYAPIEQATYRDGHEFPTSMDVYALGATVYKMLSGNRPADASEVLNNGFPAAPLRSKGVPEAVVSCIEKSMAPTKRQRYQTVDEFIHALKSGANVASNAEENVINETEVEIIEASLPQPLKPSLNTPSPEAQKPKPKRQQNVKPADNASKTKPQPAEQKPQKPKAKKTTKPKTDSGEEPEEEIGCFEAICTLLNFAIYLLYPVFWWGVKLIDSAYTYPTIWHVLTAWSTGIIVGLGIIVEVDIDKRPHLCNFLLLLYAAAETVVIFHYNY